MSEKLDNCYRVAFDTRLTPVNIGLIVFAIILTGAFAGWTAHQYLPAYQLTEETRTLVSVSMAVVATISALVLGLLISNANSSFITRAGEVTALSADILRLDQMLRRYGPEADTARRTLRQYAEHKTADLFPEDPRDVHLCNPSTYELLQQNLTVRQFWLVRAAQPCIGVRVVAMRTGCSGRRWNDPRIGANVRWDAPYLAAADVFSPLDSEGLRPI